MPISPKRCKIVRPSKTVSHEACLEEFRLTAIEPPKKHPWFRKLICLLLNCKEEIVTEGYPRYSKYYHVHTRCVRCGNENVERDNDFPLRPKRYSIADLVIGFDKREKCHAKNPSEFLS